MKKLIIIFLMFFALASCSNKEEVDQASVPDPVVQSFYERYPVATEIKWYKDGSQYVADFDYDGDPKQARFRDDGTFLNAGK